MYSVEGAIAQARPSVPGRALALVTPMTIERSAGLESRIEVDGQGVLNLGCIATGSPMTACGTDTGRRWVVERSADDPAVDVIAQVNLPAATQP
ncbi:MAG: hypothetical protein M3Q98_02015 [Actinomycetota bacterium]|nr:hypothetical protein [Actinomycetota bacterium]